MQYGLGETVIEKICAVFARFSAIEKVVLYGSRAKGNYREGSDIDLTFYGDGFSQDDLSDVALELDDLLLPYMFDLSVFADLNHAKLKEHIERVGVVFYQKSNFKSGWKKTNIEKCIENIQYTKKIHRKLFLPQGKYPIISQEQDFINGFWSNPEDLFKVLSPVIIFGDHTKILKYVDFDFVLGADGVKIFQPKPFLDAKYFYYYLSAFPVKSLGYARHYKLLKELDITYPPLSEQKRIVAILDKAFEGINAAIANTEKNLANTRELFESYLKAIFTKKDKGWKETTLGAVCKFENGDRGKNYPSRANFVNEGILFVNAGHIDDGVIDFKKMHYITKDTFNLLSRGKIKKGDILFCLRGSLGKFAVVNEEILGAIASSLVIVRPQKEMLVDYFLHYLRSGHCKEMILKYAGGAAQPNLGAKDLAKFSISLPDIEQQNIIAKFVNDIMQRSNSMESVYNKKLIYLKQLKQSLLEKAFRGELTSAQDTLAEVAA